MSDLDLLFEFAQQSRFKDALRAALVELEQRRLLDAERDQRILALQERGDTQFAEINSLRAQCEALEARCAALAPEWRPWPVPRQEALQGVLFRSAAGYFTARFNEEHLRWEALGADGEWRPASFNGWDLAWTTFDEQD